jgi:hypothetical protein
MASSRSGNTASELMNSSCSKLSQIASENLAFPNIEKSAWLI